jgi:hypothetical protein
MDRYNLRDIRALVMMKTSWYQFGNQLVNNGLTSGDECFNIDGMNVRGIDYLPVNAVSKFTVNSDFSSLSHGYSPVPGFSMLTPIGTNSGITIDFEGNMPFMAVDAGKTVFTKTAVGYFDGSISSGNVLKHIGKGKLHPSYFISANLKYGKDAGASFVSKTRMSENLHQELQQSPVRASGTGFGTYDNVEFSKTDEFDIQPYTENSAQKILNLYGNISLPLNNKMSIDIVSLYSNSKGKEDVFENRLFNFMNNPDIHQSYFDGMIALNHKLIEKENFKLSYRLSIGLDKAQSRSGSDKFGKDFFKYAYTGSFTDYLKPSFEQVNIDGVDEWHMNGFYTTRIGYKPGTLNLGLSDYMDKVFEYSNVWENITGVYSNGFIPPMSYGLWNNYDVPVTTYSETQSQRRSIKGVINSQSGKNYFELGFEYRDDLWQTYSVDGAGIWDLAQGVTNRHISQLDRSNPIMVYQNGIFQDTVIYNRLYNPASQSQFDRNLRQQLGLPVDGTEYILLDSYDYDNNTIKYYDSQNHLQTVQVPENLLNIGMFSPGELLGRAHCIGYDAYGNKVSRKHGSLTYQDDGAQTPYAPTNTAAWLSFRRGFGKLSVIGGMRLERFDARQPVLADPYSFYRIATVAETPEYNHPSDIPGDYLVYYNLHDTKSVCAYRLGDQWYKPDGTLMNNSQLGSLQMNPVINQSHNGLHDMNFRDYKPVVSVLPSVSLSYEINSTLSFDLSYSSATRNPVNNYFDTQSYQALEYGSSDFLNNPALKPERFDNFTGVVTYFNNKGLLASVHAGNMIYSNAIEYFYYEAAYPRFYNTQVNRDKSIRIPSAGMQLQYSRPGSWWEFGANYTHNFSKKENSLSDITANSNFSLYFLSSPNVLNANAALIFHKQLEGLTIGGIWSQRSGTPYSSYQGGLNPINNGIKRMKAAKNLDLKVNYRFKQNEADASYEIFLVISNVFNFKTLYNVYGNTGKADDDGYLTTAEYQSQINSKLDPQAFWDQYALRMNSPYSYAAPRGYWLGFRINFL